MKSIAPALALLLGVFGAVATHSATALERQDDELRTLRAATSRGQNPAVLALLETAERELGAGRPEQASALLERALRIEPRNPTAWHYLGLANLELGNTTQADAMAAKSRSLVAGDPPRAHLCIAVCHRARAQRQPARATSDGATRLVAGRGGNASLARRAIARLAGTRRRRRRGHGCPR